MLAQYVVTFLMNFAIQSLIGRFHKAVETKFSYLNCSKLPSLPVRKAGSTQSLLLVMG